MQNKIVFVVLAVTLLCAWTVTQSQTKDVNLEFRVKWDGKVIPDISKVSGLRRVTEAIEHRPGGEPNIMRYSPGISKFVPIVLKRPRSFDTSFEQWANKVWNFGSGLGTEVSLRDYRKDIIIELCDDTGKVLMAFKVYRCWISEYIALTDLDVDKDASALEVLVLHHEGWERDYSIN